MATILIVEDEYSVRESLSDLLQMHKYNVVTACDGREGFEKILSHKPDLVLCDVMMPVMNGIELSLKVRKNDDLTDLPFIFLTAKTDETDIREGMNAGADDYLLKPVRANLLVQAIETRLRRHAEMKKALMNRKLFEPAANDLNSEDIVKKLTKSEHRILLMIADGKTTAEIADEIHVSQRTVEVHRYNITKKLDLYGNNALLRFVMEHKNSRNS